MERPVAEATDQVASECAAHCPTAISGTLLDSRVIRSPTGLLGRASYGRGAIHEEDVVWCRPQTADLATALANNDATVANYHEGTLAAFQQVRGQPWQLCGSSTRNRKNKRKRRLLWKNPCRSSQIRYIREEDPVSRCLRHKRSQVRTK
jgi:hypothetical protein